MNTLRRVVLAGLSGLAACSAAPTGVHTSAGLDAVTAECLASSSGVCHLVFQPRRDAAVTRLEIPMSARIRIADAARGLPYCQSSDAEIDWQTCTKNTLGQTVMGNGALVVWP
ncbi:hypothetical protein [Piscinibacter terrae]|uniref:hypothetical protein n=1 Tax=Piscinibacter terrae TaxID=2496871 RepID=UPI0013867B8D|nr:hypothetical protein [Albitalea terrae]